MMTFFLDVTWGPGVELPRYIGPFETDVEAAEFDRLNVPNGIAEILELHYPYKRGA